MRKHRKSLWDSHLALGIDTRKTASPRQGAKARYLIPDYQLPAALLVPHGDNTLRSLLEAIAEAASYHVGVILLSGQREMSETFVAAQAEPERFHIITAPYDTPWLRDRSPIAVAQDQAIHWVLPSVSIPERPLDEQLFTRIVRMPLEAIDVELAQGNLIAGPRGHAVVMSTPAQNRAVLEYQLSGLTELLGVRRWIIAPAFAGEMTGHADLYVRFLAPTLAAIAWSEDHAQDRECCTELEARLRVALPNLRILRLPIRSDGEHYASPLNWLQFGKQLIIPRYDLTSAADIRSIKQQLQQAGYKADFIYSPTLEQGGSLHCLSAAIYLNP